MSNYTVVEYTTKKDKKYYIQVYLRKKSMGIRNTTDMLELCYREKFEILVPIKVELQTLLISARMSNTILDVALKELSKHTFSSDIGSNINEDSDRRMRIKEYDEKRREHLVWEHYLTSIKV